MSTRDVHVLILSSELDFATDRVCRELAATDVPFLRLNRETLTQAGLTLDPVRRTLLCRREDVTWHAGEGLRSVWWRQGTFDRNPTRIETPVDEQMVRTQWSAFMRATMALDHPVWVNEPSHVYRAETKAVQLREAARIGFDVPATLMTNDRDADVPSMVGHRIALKSVDTLLLRQGEDQLFGYTTLADWPDIANEHLRMAPATVQSALEEKLDLRVTVLGEEMWCVAVTNGGVGIGGDWRLTAKEQIRITDHPLPAAVGDRCIELVRRLGLLYGAIDLALAGGRHWFIEVNPTGEWGWLDCDSRPLASRIAHFLAAPC